MSLKQIYEAVQEMQKQGLPDNVIENEVNSREELTGKYVGIALLDGVGFQINKGPKIIWNAENFALLKRITGKYGLTLEPNGLDSFHMYEGQNMIGGIHSKEGEQIITIRGYSFGDAPSLVDDLAAEFKLLD